MFCKTCRKYEQIGSFVTGSRIFKLESIKAHDAAEGHRKWTEKEEALKKAPGTSEAEKAIQSLNEADFTRLAYLFRNAHAVGKKGRPFSDCEWLFELDQAKGLHVGNSYKSRKQATEFLHYIAEVQRKTILNTYNGAAFLSIITDGTTDSSITETEMVYCRSAIHGKIHTTFIGVTSVERGSGAHLLGAVSSIMDGQFGESWRGKVVGLGVDGASVNTGKHNGLIALMKRELDRPFIQGIHCSAHRLELSYKDSMKQVPLFSKVDTFLLNLYLFYSKSTLNRSMLRRAYDSCGMKTHLMPTRVGGTRWVPHTRRALENLLTGYPAFMQHLSQVL